MRDRFTEFLTDESGVAFPEYALILALLSIGLLAMLIIFRDSIGLVFDRLASALKGGVNAAQGYQSSASRQGG